MHIPPIPSHARCVFKHRSYTACNPIKRWWHRLPMHDKAVCIWLVCVYAGILVWGMLFLPVIIVLGA